MDARLLRRVQRYGWDRAAGYYDMYWARQLKLAQDRLLALAELRPRVGGSGVCAPAIVAGMSLARW